MSAAVDVAGPPVALRASGVVRRYRNGRGVGPVDLEVRAGEVVALMGRNGCGKTTLLRVLAGLLRPQQGSTAAHGGAWRRRIGFAPDDPVEEGALTPRQSTFFWCRQWIDDPRRAESLTASALDGVGLGERADEPVAGLSYGQRRRLGLAQALAHRPDVALLDEPTSGLDPDGVDMLTTLLRDRAGESLTTVLASSDCTFVERVATRVVFLDEGLVVRDAPLRELLESLPPGRLVELRLPGPLPAALPAGMRAVGARDGWQRVELDSDAELPRLIELADALPGGVLAVRLRAHDLRDCFREVTGHELDASGEAPA